MYIKQVIEKITRLRRYALSSLNRRFKWERRLLIGFLIEELTRHNKDSLPRVI